MNINGFENRFPMEYAPGKTASGTKTDFAASVGRASAGAAHVVNIDADALFSIYDAQTGESANVYKADDYSEDNPIYLVKGIDRSGNSYEQAVDVRTVNPNNCSYTEMLALNVHTGNRSDKDFLTMSILKDQARGFSYHEKADYLSMAYGLMNDMKTLGNWDGYLRYGKWINDILTFCKSGTGLLQQHRYEAGRELQRVRQDANSQSIHGANGYDEEQVRQRDEEESDTEIIVKADGSKVMMTTVRVGGMETVMSMEISGPDDSLPESPGGGMDDSNVMVSNTNAAIASAQEK